MERVASIPTGSRGLGDAGSAVIHVWRFDPDSQGSATALGEAAERDGLSGDGPFRVEHDRLGRPRVVAGRELEVSVTRGGGLGLVAISTGPRVGIDIEPASSARHVAAIARSYLPAGAVGAIRALPRGARAGAWLELWTRLEASAKLAGMGIGNLDPEVAAALLGRPVTYVPLAVGSGFVAVLAVESSRVVPSGPEESSRLWCSPA